MMQNEKFEKKSFVDNVCANTFKFCKPSKLIRWLRYVNTNIKTKDLSSMLNINEPKHEISNNVVCATSKGSDQPAHTRSLISPFARRLNIL